MGYAKKYDMKEAACQRRLKDVGERNITEDFPEKVT